MPKKSSLKGRRIAVLAADGFEKVELTVLRDALNRAVDQSSCHLVTLLGAAGIGKSRLLREFLDEAGARVVIGRCLPYGEGITYWPLAEIVREIARAKGLDGGEESAATIAARLAEVVERELAT